MLLKNLDLFINLKKEVTLNIFKEGIPTKIVIIPNHSEIAKGTLKSILEQADITLDEFTKNL